MKKVTNKEAKKFFELVKNSNNILITGHEFPDADVIGSALSLFIVINKLYPRKKIEIYFKDKIPDYLKFLPYINKIKTTKKISQKRKYDLGIILECIDSTRMGGIIDFSQAKYIANIDHHLNNQNYLGNNMLNIVYPEYASCAEIVFDIFKINKIKLNKDIALCIYVGIVTDTGMFQWNNTNTHSFSVAGELLLYGIEPYFVYKKLYRNKSYKSMLLLSKVLNTMKFKKIKKYLIGMMEVTQEMLRQTNTTFQDTENFINFIMDVANTNIGILFKEENSHYTKVSFRSDTIDVEKICKNWGGGGHKSAAGAMIEGGIEEVKYKVLRYLKKVLK
ncbi:MAG: bifunctional oligoribonuclease/PAP phosphatase NrnA [Endomicrobia bacterium]|nr:bifunctional oligoribonuclease/PAP phosphatase NrnA [Endomicrobiia bacterium]